MKTGEVASPESNARHPHMQPPTHRVRACVCATKQASKAKQPHLEAVGHDLGGEPAAEEADEAVLLDDALHRVRVGDVLLVGLLVHLFS